MCEKDWIRHGDVILQKTEKVLGKQEKAEETILAEGEVTGHAHRLSGSLLVSEFEGQRFVELEDDGVLSHEEHDPLTIPRGKYQVLLQREVDLAGEVRQVMD